MVKLFHYKKNRYNITKETNILLPREKNSNKAKNKKRDKIPTPPPPKKKKNLDSVILSFAKFIIRYEVGFHFNFWMKQHDETSERNSFHSEVIYNYQ